MAVFLSQSTWGYYTQSPLVPLSFTGLAEFDTKPLHLEIQFVKIRKIYKRLQMLLVNFTEHQHILLFWKSLDIRYCIEKKIVIAKS